MDLNLKLCFSLARSAVLFIFEAVNSNDLKLLEGRKGLFNIVLNLIILLTLFYVNCIRIFPSIFTFTFLKIPAQSSNEYLLTVYFEENEKLDYLVLNKC